jgi:hypothetical protein
MVDAEVVAAIAAVVAMTLALHVLLLFELRWQGRLLNELREALLKRGSGAHPELAPPSAGTPVEVEAELIEDSKVAWDRRLAEHAGDEAPPTQPSALPKPRRPS